MLRTDTEDSRNSSRSETMSKTQDVEREDVPSTGLWQKARSWFASNGEHKEKTLRMWPAVFLICGEVAGVGILSMPYALTRTGWIGIAILISLGVISCYTGKLLTDSWIMLTRLYPEYTKNCRYPYAAIGEKTLGKWGRYSISFFMNLTLFGAGVVFIVLAAQNSQAFLSHVCGIDSTLCFHIVLWGAIFSPVTWFGSPQDFWQLGLGAWLATVVVLLLVIVEILTREIEHPMPESCEQAPSFKTLFLGFGTFMFAFGVHPSLPIIQNDMKNQEEFVPTLIRAFSITTILYLPLPIIAYLIYGSNISSNILVTIPSGVPQGIALVTVTLHLLMATNTVWNALYQEAEHVLKVPHKFCWQRVVVRTILMFSAVFIALLLPHFGILLDLIGGLCLTMLTFFYPPVCYYLLRKSQGTHKDIAIWERLLLIECVLLGFLGAGVSFGTGVTELATNNAFSKPCLSDWYYLTTKIVAGM